MQKVFLVLALIVAAGCAPRQDPGIPIPKSTENTTAASVELTRPSFQV